MKKITVLAICLLATYQVNCQTLQQVIDQGNVAVKGQASSSAFSGAPNFGILSQFSNDANGGIFLLGHKTVSNYSALALHNSFDLITYNNYWGWKRFLNHDATNSSYTISLMPDGGNVSIGAGSALNRFQVNSDNAGSGAANWIAGNFGGKVGDRVVMGLLNGVASIGAHSNALNAWSNIAINPDGGNVGIGTFDPSLGGTTFSRFTINQQDDQTGLAIGNLSGTPRFALNGRSGGLWTMYDYAAGHWIAGISQKAGKIGVGTDAPFGKLHVAGVFSGGIIEDVNDRPSVGVTGHYPQAILMSGGSNNVTHGPTVMLGSFDSGTSGSHKHWSIGTAGQGSTFLDLGYAADNLNPHAGVRNYDGSTVMTLLNSGNIGFGVLNPTYALTLKNNKTISFNEDSTNPFGIEGGDNAQTRVIMGAASGSSSNIAFGVSNGTGSVGFIEKMRIDANGDVGIGTTTPKEKLSVNGKIRAHEIKVETANWPDYVFSPSYKLPDLSETEQFIKENQHLPEIPSAAEVEKDGVSLGEMNAKLLKKIEELTLHLIQKEKELDAQQKLNQLQEERLSALEQALKSIVSK
jgi:hypothetical protein